MSWIICNTEDDFLLWSQEIGWTEDEYDTFTDEEKESVNLPLGGVWEKVPWSVAD